LPFKEVDMTTDGKKEHVSGGDPKMSPPIHDCSPRLDDVVTSTTPLLCWLNCGDVEINGRNYVLQLDNSPLFNSGNLMEYGNILETVYATGFRVEKPLKDNTRYFWRVKCQLGQGKESPWSSEFGGLTPRFDVDTTWDDHLLFQRVDCVDIIPSSGAGDEHIQAYEESGLNHWRGSTGEDFHTIDFDLGRIVTISRIWMLTAPAGWSHENACKAWVLSHVTTSGRLEGYAWQSSVDKENWIDIPGTAITGFQGYKAVVQLEERPVTARFFRLVITAWTGDAPTVNEITFYETCEPPAFQVPCRDYVLVIRNEQTFVNYEKQDWRNAIMGREGHTSFPWDLGVVEVNHAQINNQVLKGLEHKPVAIFLTGQGRWWEMMPIFEFNGEMEIIRETDIPLLGVCGGHQMLAAQQERTFPQNTGRYHGAYDKDVKNLMEGDIAPIKIIVSDPCLQV